jgi:anaphase-promoting complex subunit 8
VLTIATQRAAELLNALPESTEADEQAEAGDTKNFSPIYTSNTDPEEAALEAKELSKYLLAKSLFDCREYDRCAAVFLPDSLLSSLLSTKVEGGNVASKAKGKAKAAAEPVKLADAPALPKISQKSLFLALYAKFMSGEKRKDEDSEMVMGPQDLGTVTNKQLLVVGRYLSTWFEQRTTDDDEVVGSQGWLEYLCVQMLHGYEKTLTVTGTAWYLQRKRTTTRHSNISSRACTSTP